MQVSFLGRLWVAVSVAWVGLVLAACDFAVPPSLWPYVIGPPVLLLLVLRALIWVFSGE